MDFSQTWPVELQDATTYTYGWSFVLAGLGIFTTVLASTLWYLSYVYFWVSEFAKPTVDEKDLQSYSNNNNSPESGNSAETTMTTQDCRKRGAVGASAPSVFDRSVNPISTRGGTLSLPSTTSPLAMALATDLDLMESNQFHP